MTTFKDRIMHPGEVERYLDSAGNDFIDDELIERQIAENRNPDPQRIRDILQKSRAIQTLEPAETAALLNVEDPELLEEMKRTAFEIKLHVYDNRIVTFAPLYVSNHCVNSCEYCGFRVENRDMIRRRLTMEEIAAETRALAGTYGHKRLVAVFGEHPSSHVDYIVDTINTIYDQTVPTRKGHASIRRVNVNAAPLGIEDLKRVKEAGIGTFQVFQETYHHDTYRKLHGSRSPKSDYRWRLYCMHRALDAGIDDVGIGALFGLYDWKFEVMGLLSHVSELERGWNGIGAHTISFPRLEPASNAPIATSSPYMVSDEDFLKIITVLRLSVPYTGMICTARETAAIRDQAVRLGVTQMDASTRVGIGAYSESGPDQEENRQQFMLGDTRTVDELIGDLAAMGFITSFCTAGYRIGRTGDRIMKLLRTCKEGHFCKLNAVLTFREWLDDFGGEETRQAGEALIRRELSEALAHTVNNAERERFLDFYQRTESGVRDLYL